MSFYLLINNLHFAFAMMGAMALIMAAWLIWDSYKILETSTAFIRFCGIFLFSIWNVFHALDINNDLLLYVSYFILILGLALIVISFLKTEKLSVNAVLIIPAFSLYLTQLSAISTILFFAIAYLAFRQWKREYNKTWIPFAVSFLFFGLAYFLNISHDGIARTSFVFILSTTLSLFAAISMGAWVWQYMRLRIRESMVMILVGATFILSTIVTLAFTTILIERVVMETSNNLINDVKVLDFTINGMKEEALSKVQLVASDPEIIRAVNSNDFSSLDEISGLLLEKYNLGFLIVADKNGSVLVRGNALSKRGDSLLGEKSFEEALNKNSIVTIEDSQAEGFSVRAGAPIYDKNSRVIGVVIDGFELDNALMDKMKRLTGFDKFVYKDDVSVAGSAFGINGRTRLVGDKVTNQDIMDLVFNDGKNLTLGVEIQGNKFRASYLPLINADEKIIGMISSAKLEQDIVNIANATNRLTLITVLLILIALIFPIYFSTKKLSSSV